VRFQVLTAASMMLRVVFWDILPCKMIVDRRFRGAYCLHHQGWVLNWTELHTRRSENFKSKIVVLFVTSSVETYLLKRYIMSSLKPYVFDSVRTFPSQHQPALPRSVLFSWAIDNITGPPPPPPPATQSDSFYILNIIIIYTIQTYLRKLISFSELSSGM
jgi:hypothetical protein